MGSVEQGMEVLKFRGVTRSGRNGISFGRRWVGAQMEVGKKIAGGCADGARRAAHGDSTLMA